MKKIQEKETQSKDIIFIRSFTGNKDKLMMWDSSYADNGRGVSIGIPAYIVNKGQGTPDIVGLTINTDKANAGIEKQKGQPVPLGRLGLFKIAYDRDCVREIAKCLAKFYNKDFKNDKLTELLARLFVPVATLIKHKDYEHENEYRLIYIASWEDDTLKKYIKHTPEDGVYIETEKVLFKRFDDPESDYLDEYEEYVDVYMGPKVDKITWLKWRDRFRYEYPDVTIEPSSIEWR